MLHLSGFRFAASGCCWSKLPFLIAAAVLLAGCNPPAGPAKVTPKEDKKAGETKAADAKTATDAKVAAKPEGKPDEKSTSAAPSAVPAGAKPDATANTPAPAMKHPPTGASLYLQHCAACHGDKGDGQGVAAMWVFPRPRNFRTAKFRLISTTNGVPAESDLEAVLVRGMPGSAMPPWPKLTATERKLLITRVQELIRDGLREQLVSAAKQQGDDPPEEAEIVSFITRRTKPEPAAAVTALGESSPEAVARGKELYVKQSCHSCHGEQGKGDGVQKMVDDDKTPTRPRDLTRGIFKGGHDPASVYYRIALGMPGTPMPSSPNLKPEQIADMVHFIRSLSTEAQRTAAVLSRQKIKAARAAELPSSVDDAAWSASGPTSISTTPLWWRDDAQPQLTVQALHSDKEIALRISWSDATQNAAAVRPDEFEDGAAVQWFAGESEPFLGMGAAGAVVDVWQWRAGTKNTGEADHQSDEYPFDTPLYRELAKGKPLPDFVTARAGGNPLAVRETSGASQAAKGPGSLTFRLKPAQNVAAEANWKDGRWSVVLRRPLAAAGEGIALESGHSYSIAFALWDGAARERGGQKVISIWNDVTLE